MTATKSGQYEQDWSPDALGNIDGPANDANEIDGLSYDRAGNMTADLWKIYKYDAWDRLVEVDDASADVLARYQYDGLGRKTLSAAATTTPGTLDSYTYYLYAGQQVAETRVSSSPVSDLASLAPEYQ